MTNSKKDSELREWLADFATGQQGDTYYTTSPDDVSDSDIEELKQIIATNYITKEESDRRVLEMIDSDIEELKQIIATNYITKEESDRRVLEMIDEAWGEMWSVSLKYLDMVKNYEPENSEDYYTYRDYVGRELIAELRELLKGDKE